MDDVEAFIESSTPEKYILSNHCLDSLWDCKEFKCDITNLEFENKSEKGWKDRCRLKAKFKTNREEMSEDD